MTRRHGIVFFASFQGSLKPFVMLNTADTSAFCNIGSSTAVLETGKWEHLALSYDDVAGDVRMYKANSDFFVSSPSFAAEFRERRSQEQEGVGGLFRTQLSTPPMLPII